MPRATNRTWWARRFCRSSKAVSVVSSATTWAVSSGVGLIRVRVVGMAVVSVAGWLIVIPFFMFPVVGGARPAPRSAVSPRGFAERLIPVLAHVLVRSLARQVVEHVCGELVSGIGGTCLPLQERPQLLEVPGNRTTLPSRLMSLLTLLTDLGGCDLLAARSKVVERLDLLVGR